MTKMFFMTFIDQKTFSDIHIHSKRTLYLSPVVLMI